MKSVLQLSLFLAQGIHVLGTTTIGAPPKCNADNCYRALFPCPSPSAVSVASAFCATITASGTTATNYPTRATNACGLTPGRYISACKCGPTCSYTTSTTTTTVACPSATPSNGGLTNGDFECPSPSPPWTVQILDPSFSLSTTTSNFFTGARALLASLTGQSTCSGVCVNARIVFPLLPITPNTDYKLTLATFFPNNTDGSNSSTGFIGVQINGRTGLTIDSNDDLPREKWRFRQSPWRSLPGETTAEIRIEWIGPPSLLDTVTFAPVSAYSGSTPPPLGILPGGEFENSLGSWTQQVPDPGATAGIVSLPLPGQVNPDYRFGSKAWRVVSPLKPNPANQELLVSARLISPTIPVVPGKKYLISFSTYFDAFGIGFVGLMVNNQPVYTRDPADQGQGGINWWGLNTVYWTAPENVSSAQIKFEAVMAEKGTMGVDAVVMVEVNPSVTAF
ncbi:hypothetical protein QBC32DRAFT_165840 [Pseudoneurospora amorphoporcata]|uniref:Uncharacterized protein n=1 Tax=Pseudoneurospora amorphoporcata TaxID=241081 RepID=A0AAN6SF30_9PEZI|nr:hypothetical protein QBC32DRAFT_165840 [Pseudoneurospora amorphoporcata]